MVGSRSGWPTSHRSDASADGAIPRAPASGCPGAAAMISRQRRNGADAIRAERSGPGCGPSAMSARRCSSRSPNVRAGHDLDRDLEALVARGERLDERRDVLGDEARRDDQHPPRGAGRVLHGAARLLGEAEDLARQRGEPPAARRERDPAPLAHEQLVPELPAQRRDGDRDRRLGDLELGRRRLHGAEAGDEDERLELREGHV